MSDPDLGSPQDNGERVADTEELREVLDIEELMEERPEGPLSIISDQDIPGEPG